jgi:hypothetical protein
MDIVVENETADFVGIEVKGGGHGPRERLQRLRKLADATGDALRLGLVLYDGDRTVPFGDRMFTAPVSCLWG